MIRFFLILTLSFECSCFPAFSSGAGGGVEDFPLLAGVREKAARLKRTRSDHDFKELRDLVFGKDLEGVAEKDYEDFFKQLASYVALHVYSNFILVSPSVRAACSHLTLVFTMQPDFYDHSGILYEDNWSNPGRITALYFDLSLRDGRSSSGVMSKSGVSSVDYSVKRELPEVIVKYLFMSYSDKDEKTRLFQHYPELVQHYPYRTFFVPESAGARRALDDIRALSLKDTYPYSVYNDNCIVFSADVLHKFGVFGTKTTKQVRKYGKTYPCKSGGISSLPHSLVHWFASTPEWLKMMVDDPEMVACPSEPHEAATLPERSPKRIDPAFSAVSPQLSTSLISALCNTI